MITENEISYAIRGAIFKTYNDVGPGLFESVYEAILNYLLLKDGFIVRTQVPLPVFYDGIQLDLGFRIDMIVNEAVIVEIKSIEALNNVHHKQLSTYLKLSGKKLGLLVNFNSDDIQKSIIRIVNGL